MEGQQKEQKITQILECLEDSEVDLWQLRELALTSGGLINGDIRKVAWNKLVGLSSSSSSSSNSSSEEEVPTTSKANFSGVSPRDSDLIRQDVRRSVLFRYHKTKAPDTAAPSNNTTPTTCNSTEFPFTSASILENSTPEILENKLVIILESTLAFPRPTSPAKTSQRQNNTATKMNYYQGLHDVAGVLLYNLGLGEANMNNASAILRRICTSHLRDATREDFSELDWLLRTVLLPLVQQVDRELHDFLLESQVELSNTILPWIITWFTHDIHDEQVASRLVDAFLASHPLLPLYFAVSIIVHPYNRWDIILSECDPAMVHMTIRDLLTKVGGDISTQELIDNSLTLMTSTPPSSLLKVATSYHHPENICEQGSTSVTSSPSSSSSTQLSGWERASGIFLLKTPPSWALAATARRSDAELSKGGGTIIANERILLRKKSINNNETQVRARLASGVPFIMKTVDSSNMNFILKRLRTSSNDKDNLMVKEPVWNAQCWEIVIVLAMMLSTSTAQGYATTILQA